MTMAANGNDALASRDGEGLDPDLVITDVVMPGISGKELIERLRNYVPGRDPLHVGVYR